MVQKSNDDNGRKILNNGWGRLNPKSYNNINQVTVPRYDKNGVPVPGIDRVCLDLSWVNRDFKPFEHPIPAIQSMVQDLSDYHYFTELDLCESYNQLAITEELGNILTFSCSFQ